MKDLETRLREDMEREKERQDPGAAFWAELPAATWQAYQAEAERRHRRWAWLRRWALPIATTCAAAAALLIVWRTPPRPTPPPGQPPVVEWPTVEQAAEQLDEAALERLANELDVRPALATPAAELLEHWNIPVDVVVDDLNDKQLAALAEHLGKG